MSRSLIKQYPPYLGNEPYMLMCFAPQSEEKILPLLDRLCRRGVRVWYPYGKVTSVADAARQAERIKNASFMVFWADSAAAADVTLKGLGLAYGKGVGAKPQLLINDGLSGTELLGLGFSASVPSVSARDLTPEQTEYAVIGSNGFSRLLIGTPRELKRKEFPLLKVLLAVAAMAVLAFGVFFFTQRTAPKQEDTVFIAEFALQNAVREALDGGPVTEASLAGVRELVISEPVADWEELTLLPNLEKISFPAEIAASCPDRVLEAYTCTLTGGAK